LTPAQEIAIRQIGEIVDVMGKRGRLFLSAKFGDSVLIELSTEAPKDASELRTSFLDESGRETGTFTGRVVICRHGPFTFREAAEVLERFHGRDDVEVKS